MKGVLDMEVDLTAGGSRRRNMIGCLQTRLRSLDLRFRQNQNVSSRNRWTAHWLISLEAAI